jgi:hypothetical protein
MKFPASFPQEAFLASRTVLSLPPFLHIFEDRHTATMASTVIVAIDHRRSSSESPQATVDPGGGNAQGSLKVGVPVAGERPIVNHQDVIEGMNKVRFTRDVKAVLEVHGGRGDELEAEQVGLEAPLSNVVMWVHDRLR